MTPTIRGLTTMADFEAMLALEQEVWGCGTEDAVPVCLMVVNAKIGGVMLGAFDEANRLVGFVYAVPGWRHGTPLQWSHITGVRSEWRGRGLGLALKREQRRITLERGVCRIDWTFDPLQAENAHLNLTRLGARAREYHRDVYGNSASILHAGTATDRLIAEWHLNEPRVLQRLDPAWAPCSGDRSLVGVPVVNRAVPGTRWLVPEGLDLAMDDAPCVGLLIPTGFTEMQQRDVGLARAWRSVTRAAFEHLLSRGYQVTDFVLDRSSARGTYLLTLEP
jgi:chorismate synthase